MNDFYMSCNRANEEYDIIERIVGMGIDSYLESFIDSTFTLNGYRLYVTIPENEMSIFMRRLSTLAENNSYAYSLEDDILFVQYGIEIV